MKRKMKNDIMVEGSGEMKMYGIEKSWRKCKCLKTMNKCFKKKL